MKVRPIELALYAFAGLALLWLGWMGVAQFFRGLRFRRLRDVKLLSSPRHSGLDFESARWGMGEVLCIFGFHYFGTAICAYALVSLADGLHSQWLHEAYPQSAEKLLVLSHAGILPSLAPPTLAVYLYSNVLAAALTVVVACQVITGLGRSPMSSVGLQRPPSPRDLGRLVLLFASFFPICQIVRVVWAALLESMGHRVGYQPPLQFYFEAVERMDPLWIALLAVNAVCVAPVVEELLFRGVLHGFLSRKLGFFWAAGLSAFLFAVVHVTPSVLLPIFVLGFLLAAIYERRGSLYENILFHALFNAVTLVIGWLIVTYGSPEWLKNA